MTKFALYLRLFWAVLTGHQLIALQTRIYIIMADLTQTTAQITALGTALTTLIAQGQSDATALATATTDLANVDATVSGQLAPLVAQAQGAIVAPTA